jgi:transaldolase
MKLFLDTADPGEVEEGAKSGLIEGVTTNPTLLQRAGASPTDGILRLCELVDGPVSAEAVSERVDDLVREARDLSGIHGNVVVKIPVTFDGLKAVKLLAEEGIRTNVTLCFSVNQALLAAKAGASFVSPFVGRLDDAGHDGMEVVREIVTVFDNYGFSTEVIVASVRGTLHVREAALAGADIATVPYAVFKKLYEHPLTKLGIERFMSDWKRLQGT